MNGSGGALFKNLSEALTVDGKNGTYSTAVVAGSSISSPNPKSASAISEYVFSKQQVFE